MSCRAKEQAHFAASLLRVQLTAIGRIPPSFLRRATNAPKKWGRIAGVVSPLRIRSQLKLTRASGHPPWLVRSFRCCGRKPSGPQADLPGRERMAFLTFCSVIWSGNWLGSGGGPIFESGMFLLHSIQSQSRMLSKHIICTVRQVLWHL